MVVRADLNKRAIEVIYPGLVLLYGMDEHPLQQAMSRVHIRLIA